MDLDFKHDETAFGGRFYADLDAQNQAEITYQTLSSDLRVCNHTGVPNAYQGQGIAFKLVEALVMDARQNGQKYIPLCPYVAFQFKRHPEWSDVFVESEHG